VEQQTFHGAYIWWQISTGAQPPSYTIGSATNSAWILEEWSGNDAAPYDTSNGTFTQANSNTQATPTITPSTGERLLCAMMGGSLSTASLAAETVSWSNTFTTIRDVGNATGTTKDWVGAGYRLVTGDGVTGYTTTGTCTGSTGTLQSRSGLIIAFKAAGAPVPFDPQYIDWPLRQPHPKMRGAA
jgi:hypothetical protein